MRADNKNPIYFELVPLVAAQAQSCQAPWLGPGVISNQGPPLIGHLERGNGLSLVRDGLIWQEQEARSNYMWSRVLLGAWARIELEWREINIFCMDTGLDGFMSDLKRPWLSEKGTKMSCSFMQKLSVLTRQEARVTAPANQKPGSGSDDQSEADKVSLRGWVGSYGPA